VDELGLRAGTIGGDRGQSLDRSRKRRPVLGLEMIIRLPRRHVAAQHRAPARGAAGGDVSASNSRWLGRAHAPHSWLVQG
jgi:hypothetical protein